MRKNIKAQKEAFLRTHLDVDHLFSPRNYFSHLSDRKQSFDEAYNNLFVVPHHNSFVSKEAVLPLTNIQEYVFEPLKEEPISISDFSALTVAAQGIFERRLHHQIQISESFFEYLVVERDTSNAAKISEINEKLRRLKLQLKQHATNGVFIEIKKLAHELRSLISFHYEEQKKLIIRSRKILPRNRKRDIRKSLRSMIRCFSKLFNDFSDCEEEVDAISTSAKAIFLFHNLNKNVKEAKHTKVVRNFY